MAPNLPSTHWKNPCWKTFVALIFLTLLFLSNVSANAAPISNPASNPIAIGSHKISDSNKANADKVAGLIPVIMLLLDEEGSIPLRVGQANTRGYTSERYPNGIGFEYGALTDDVRLTIDAVDIPSGAQIEVLINGVLVGTLSNGRNTFTVPANGRPNNQIFIRTRAGTTGRWTITRLFGLLISGPQSRAEAQRFLTRATFGPTLAEINRVMEIGYEAWLDEQIAVPTTLSLPFMDQALQDRLANRRKRLVSEGVTDPNVLNITSLGKGQRANSRLDSWMHTAITGRDQLRQRMAFALSQIFVVGDSLGDSALRARAYAHYHDVLARNALGSYRTLLKDVTVNPAMGNWLSFRGNIRLGRNGSTSQPDENYAREIQQLFTIGLIELNMDGTPRLDNNGQEIETYSQAIVSEFAKVFTGWNFIEQQNNTRPVPGWETLTLRPWNGEPNTFHDYSEKQLHVYPGTDGVNPAGLTTEADLDRALDNLFNHPNVAPFIAKQLIQRLVTSNPSNDYVERVARVFHRNNGVRGDLAEVAKAILLDPEALNSHENPRGGKLKEPLLRYIQLWRSFNARSTGPYFRFSLPERTTGQRPIGAATVFNFYPPDYAPSGPIEDAGLVAPEFLLTGDGLNISYLNRLRQYARSADFGDAHPLYSDSFQLGIKLDLSEALRRADDTGQLLNLLDERLLGGLMSPGLRRIITSYIDNLPDEDDVEKRRLRNVEEALILVTASPEYSIQR